MVTFDPAKDAANQHKHGVSLAAFVAMTGRLYTFDAAHSATELRSLVIGKIDGRLYVAAVTYRVHDEVRVISLRPASRRERRKYDEATAQ